MIFLTTLTAVIFITVASSPLVFRSLISPLHLVKISGLNVSTLMKNYLVVVNYLLNPFNNHLVFPNFIQSSAGLRHFFEVKQLILVNNVVFLCGLICSFFVFRSASRSKYWLTLKRSLLFLIVIPFVLIFLMFATDFNQFFVEFHMILFRNSDWIFDPMRDPIINILPEEFFEVEFIFFFVLWVLVLLIMNILINRQIKKELSLNNSMDISITR
ncbi:TIGR01906 family membrane protein [Xylocopilactobacillus apicola]|uniref:TIGR01906 family membrane protein n=1 Tax=Xylocopilactobacillus apicola TaxID=2932184 RepID=UPI002952FADE|nr:TIGR01906 family membrane protein [Xylocopilactobacillus apicola]